MRAILVCIVAFVVVYLAASAWSDPLRIVLHRDYRNDYGDIGRTASYTISSRIELVYGLAPDSILEREINANFHSQLDIHSGGESHTYTDSMWFLDTVKNSMVFCRQGPGTLAIESLINFPIPEFDSMTDLGPVTQMNLYHDTLLSALSILYPCSIYTATYWSRSPWFDATETTSAIVSVDSGYLLGYQYFSYSWGSGETDNEHSVVQDLWSLLQLSVPMGPEAPFEERSPDYFFTSIWNSATIYDIRGRRLIEIANGPGLDRRAMVKALPPGILIARITAEKGQPITVRIVNF